MKHVWRVDDGAQWWIAADTAAEALRLFAEKEPEGDRITFTLLPDEEVLYIGDEDEPAPFPGARIMRSDKAFPWRVSATARDWAATEW